MKLCSYRHEGLDRYGVMTDDGIIDLSTRIGDQHPTLVRLLRDQAIDEARAASEGFSPDYGLGEVEFLPLTSETVEIICVGLNYKDHLAETGKKPAENPSAFTKIRQSFVGQSSENLHGTFPWKMRLSTLPATRFSTTGAFVTIKLGETYSRGKISGIRVPSAPA